jgi:hypothetical protein
MSAIALALLAMIVSEQFKPLKPEGTDFGIFTYVNGAIGAIVGWRFIGSRAGNGVVQSINAGLTGMLVLVLATLFVHAFWIMQANSFKLRYSSTTQAIQDMFNIMTENGLLLMQSYILITLVGGALFCGLVSEATARRWK